MDKILFDEQFLRKLERFTLISKRLLVGRGKGERRSNRKGTSLEFADYRPYTTGDDLRQIDWNIYARLDRLFLKLFEEEEDLTVHLLVDTSKSMDWGEPNKLRYGLQTAAAIGYIALASLDHLTVSAFNSRLGSALPVTKGKQQVFRLLDFLSNITADGDSTDLAQSLELYARRNQRAGLAVVISDLLTDTYQRGLKNLLFKRYEVILIHILDESEIHPQLNGDLRLVDRETGGAIEVTLNGEMMARYETRFTEWCEEIQRFCSKAGISYIRTSTAVPFEDLVLQYLRRKGVLV